MTVPRVVIAAPGSGHGKTSVATGLLGALRQRGLAVSPHKVGPDYIDPGYHALAAGRPGRNLDPWLVGEDQIVPMFTHGASTPAPADIAIIEGVMGLFDGASGRGDFASTAHVARLLGAPIILVVDAAGVSSSAAALLHGFATWDQGTRLGGVIFNRVGSAHHERLLRDAAGAAGVPVLGVIRRLDQLAVPSRHLGLVPAAELGGDAAAAVGALTTIVGSGVDLEAVLRLARTAGALPDTAEILAERTVVSAPPPRIAVAGGAAFTFGYAEHPELLAAAGAEVVTFDPVRDEKLPDQVHGLVIGGGFPEEHAADLSANASLRAVVAALAEAGAPVIAECAGLLYLSRSLDGHPMCGVLRGRGRDDEQAHARLPRRRGRHLLTARTGRDPRPRPRVPSHRHPVRRPDGERVAVDRVRIGGHRGFRPRPRTCVLPAHALGRPTRRGRSHHRRRPRLPGVARAWLRARRMLRSAKI